MEPKTLAERLVEAAIDFLERELKDPAVVADFELLLGTVSGWLDEQIAAADGVPPAPPTPTAQQSVAPPVRDASSVQRPAPTQAALSVPAAPISSAPADVQPQTDQGAFLRRVANIVRHE